MCRDTLHPGRYLEVCSFPPLKRFLDVSHDLLDKKSHVKREKNPRKSQEAELQPLLQTQSVRAAPTWLLQVDGAALLVCSWGGRRRVLAFPAITLTCSLSLKNRNYVQKWGLVYIYIGNSKVKQISKIDFWKINGQYPSGIWSINKMLLTATKPPPFSTYHACHLFICLPIWRCSCCRSLMQGTNVRR